MVYTIPCRIELPGTQLRPGFTQTQLLPTPMLDHALYHADKVKRMYPTPLYCFNQVFNK